MLGARETPSVGTALPATHHSGDHCEISNQKLQVIAKASSVPGLGQGREWCCEAGCPTDLHTMATRMSPAETMKVFQVWSL